MATLLAGKDISLEFPTKAVFDTVTLSVNEGDRIGIVGKNGEGKSTLLKILGGILQPDSGELTKRSDVTIGFLDQTDALDPENTVIREIAGDLATHEWASDRKTRDILDALLQGISQESLIEELSGGQRRRVDLARLLIGDWDILMLDEPTNHLDIQAITWLANHLKTRWTKNNGALLMVTHDRWFLDEVCLSMWEVHHEKVTFFEGGYSAYILNRVERDRRIQVAEQKRKNLMRKELAWLSRGARARSTKPKFHLESALTLIEDVPPPRDTLELKKAAMTRLGKRVVDIIDVSESYGDKLVLDDITWLIGPGDRVGILGENGAGKTTLLRLIEGSLKPSSGQVKIGKTVKFSTLSQELNELEEFSQDRVREVLSHYKTSYVVDGKKMTPAQLLEQLGFEKSHPNTYVANLSGGQKRRLQLLLTLLEEPNVLILDEPGNDLDTDMLAVMEDLLDSWPGTLILVSHDRYLTERVTDDQYALIDGKLIHVPGGVEEYLKILNRKKASLGLDKSATPTTFSKGAEGKSGVAGSGGSNGKGGDTLQESLSVSPSPLSGGEAHQARKQLATIERKMEALEKKITCIEDDMMTVDSADYVALGEHQAEIQNLKDQLNEFEVIWMELSEKLES